MIRKVFINEETDEVAEWITSWTDTLSSLVKAANEAFYDPPEGCFASKVYGDCGKVEFNSFGAIGSEPDVRQEVLNQGYWIEDDGNEFEIYFDWSHDPDNRPNNRAIHG